MVECVGVSTEMPIDQRGKHKSPPGSCQPWVSMLPCVNTPGAVADTGEVLIRAVEGALTSWGHPAPRGCVCIVSHSTVGSFYSCIRSFIHPGLRRLLLWALSCVKYLFIFLGIQRKKERRYPGHRPFRCSMNRRQVSLFIPFLLYS